VWCVCGVCVGVCGVCVVCVYGVCVCVWCVGVCGVVCVCLCVASQLRADHVVMQWVYRMRRRLLGQRQEPQ